MSSYTGTSILYGDVVFSPWEGFLMAKKGLTLKKSFCMGNSQFFGLHDFSRLEIWFFSLKNSGGRHGSAKHCLRPYKQAQGLNKWFSEHTPLKILLVFIFWALFLNFQSGISWSIYLELNAHIWTVEDSQQLFSETCQFRHKWQKIKKNILSTPNRQYYNITIYK